MHCKRVRDAFFTRVEDSESQWVCKCGTKRKVTGNGYTNFVSHVQSQHAEDFKAFLADNGSTSASTESTSYSLFYQKKCVAVHGWIDFVVMGLQPFSVVENSVLIRQSKYESINHKTLGKYMQMLTERVERKISRLLPDKFALVFDGRSASDTHYVAMFATFPTSNENGYDKVLLAFSPFEDENTQNAQNHYDFAIFVLSVYEKTLSNVVALIGDNCNTNKAFAN